MEAGQKGPSAPLSEEARQVILGTLLGDGSLRRYEGYAHPRLVIRHSAKQREYLEWKVGFLQRELGGRITEVRDPTSRDQEKAVYVSSASPKLQEIFQLTSKGVRRKWLNQLRPLGLCVWWLDDGSLVRNRTQAVLCTDSFTLKEVKVARRYFQKVWGLPFRVAPAKRGTQRYRLWLRSTSETKRFLKLIAPFVPECMKQKVLLYRKPSSRKRWASEIAGLVRFAISDEDIVQASRQREGS